MRYNRQVKRAPTQAKRPNGWDARLADYIRDKRKQPFAWGTNDCLTFADDAVKAIKGEGVVSEYLGGYESLLGAKKAYAHLLEDSGSESIIDLLDARLERITGSVPRGSLAAMPVEKGAVFEYSIGVVISHLVAFVAEDGLLLVEPREDFIFWRVS